jgi:hypothetical protein
VVQSVKARLFTQRSAVLLLVVCHWGQIEVNAHPLCWGHRACGPHEFRILGQVEQESHRRPAVLEHLARCPESSNYV